MGIAAPAFTTLGLVAKNWCLTPLSYSNLVTLNLVPDTTKIRAGTLAEILVLALYCDQKSITFLSDFGG
jgi:hypothetical protein